jgi:hypothetical protein
VLLFCHVVRTFGILHHHSFLIKCIRFECHFHRNKRNRPAYKTRFKERECVCASVAFVYARQQQQLLRKAVRNCIDFPPENCEKKSVLKFRVYNPNTRNGHSLLSKNFIRESARGNRLTSPSREYQNDVVFIALLDFNPILESFDVLFDVQRDE